MKLNDKLYGLLKWLCLIVFPALATLYSVLGEQWGFPYIQQIVVTINAIGTFIGALIGLSTANYYEDDGGNSYDYEEDEEAEEKVVE